MENLYSLSSLIISLCIASGTIAVTLTKGKIFRNQRNWLRQNLPWFGRLFSCPYCLSHWIVIIMMIFYHPIVVHSGLFLIDLIISTFCIVGITVIFIGIILNLIKFESDITDEELSLVKKMSVALKEAKNVIENQKDEIERLKNQ